MNAQTKIKAAKPVADNVQYLTLADLYISKLNPRQTVSEEDVQLMAESLQTVGLIQPLNGLLDENGKVGIVAGGRRLRGLNVAVKTKPELALVPVTVTKDRDLALQWATTENIARRDLDVSEEITAYGQMAKQNKKVADIARCFGVTEKRVYKLLALASLPGRVLDALSQGQISVDVAKCMTVAKDQEKIHEALALAIENGWSQWEANRFFSDDTVSGTDSRARYLGAKAFKAAGGVITEDLFNEKQQWHDEEKVQAVFEEALLKDAEELRTGFGWAWAEISSANSVQSWNVKEQFGHDQMNRIEGTLTEKETARYDELAELAHQEDFTDEQDAELEDLQSKLDGEYSDDQKQFGGIIVYADHKGVVQIVEGLVRHDDLKLAQEAGYLPKPEKIEQGTKSDYAQAFVDDMNAVAKGSLQAKLLENPQLVLDLVAFSLSELVRYESPIGVSLRNPTNTPSKTDGFELPKAIDDDFAKQYEHKNNVSLADRFAQFRKRGQKARDTLLVEKFSRSMGLGFKDDLFALLQEETKAHPRQVWTPSETNCFKRLKAALLDDCYCDVMGLTRGKSEFKEFSKLKKAEKAKALHKLFNDKKHQKALKLSKDQIERIENWVPNC